LWQYNIPVTKIVTKAILRGGFFVAPMTRYLPIQGLCALFLEGLMVEHDLILQNASEHPGSFLVNIWALR